MVNIWNQAHIRNSGKFPSRMWHYCQIHHVGYTKANGIADKHNRTLIDMLRYVTTLPEYLYGEAHKMATHI